MPREPVRKHGVTWRLVELTDDDPVPEGVEVTAVLEDGRIGGKGGCNRYLADLASPEPGALEIGNAGVTMTMCPEPMMSVEGRYLAALHEARRLGLRFGRLLLEVATADGTGSLVFERGEGP